MTRLKYMAALAALVLAGCARFEPRYIYISDYEPAGLNRSAAGFDAALGIAGVFADQVQQALENRRYTEYEYRHQVNMMGVYVHALLDDEARIDSTDILDADARLREAAGGDAYVVMIVDEGVHAVVDHCMKTWGF